MVCREILIFGFCVWELGLPPTYRTRYNYIYINNSMMGRACRDLFPSHSTCVCKPKDLGLYLLEMQCSYWTAVQDSYLFQSHDCTVLIWRPECQYYISRSSRNPDSIFDYFID